MVEGSSIPGMLAVMLIGGGLFATPGAIVGWYFRSVRRCVIVLVLSNYLFPLAFLLAAIGILAVFAPHDYLTDVQAILALAALFAGWFLGILVPVIVFIVKDRRTRRKAGADAEDGLVECHVGRQRTGMTRKHIVWIITISIAFLSLLVYLKCRLNEVHKASEAEHAVLTTLHSTISIGDDRNAVLSRFHEITREDLHLRLEVHGPPKCETWSIRTPFEVPFESVKDNWSMMIEFNDGQVSAVKIRTLDGPAPAYGPNDK